jgi:hypothetical protein
MDIRWDRRLHIWASVPVESVRGGNRASGANVNVCRWHTTNVAKVCQVSVPKRVPYELPRRLKGTRQDKDRLKSTMLNNARQTSPDNARRRDTSQDKDGQSSARGD